MVQKEIMRYSEAFKLQVVRELEAGHFATPFAAYGAVGGEVMSGR